MSGEASPPESGAPPFGAFALPAWLAALRRVAVGSRSAWAASLARKAALAAANPPFDMEIFGGQRARLHPGENRTEKRVFTDESSWDRAEREMLERAIAGATDRRFAFVDAGANVGMYTLFMRAAARRAGVRLEALAIEPDPVNGERLAVNLALNEATETHVARAALTGGEAAFAWLESRDLTNRGEARIAEGPHPGAVKVPARSLASVVAEAGLTRIDALKIDIEGAEEPVLAAFFRDAPEELRPSLILAETRADDGRLATMLRAAGYDEMERFRLNAAYARRGRGRSAAGRDADALLGRDET